MLARAADTLVHVHIAPAAFLDAALGRVLADEYTATTRTRRCPYRIVRPTTGAANSGFFRMSRNDKSPCMQPCRSQD
jgi:hypothetical protein